MRREQQDEAFSQFFRTQYSSITALLRMMLGDAEAAHDAAQEAFVTLYAHWRKVSKYEKPGAWLRRVAIQEASRARRRSGRDVSLVRLVSREVAPDVFEEIDQSRDADLQHALLSLPLNQRVAILLHYVDDLSLAEVGAIMGCAEGTVKVHLHRGRRQLAEALKQEEPDVAQ